MGHDTAAVQQAAAARDPAAIPLEGLDLISILELSVMDYTVVVTLDRVVVLEQMVELEPDAIKHVRRQTTKIYHTDIPIHR